ncbi:MAG TPA: 3-oxoacyl-[acyl-carrier-protein] synthase III C-terminal domain-containing protein [Micromonosporaceae bacterium]
MTFGILSFGHALGEPVSVPDVVADYTDDVERVLGYGYRTLHRAGPDVGITDLAERAARQAVTRSEVDPSELDLVVFAPTDVAEYLYWDAAASLQHRLGAERAQALLVNQVCTGGLTAFDVVAGKFATTPDYRTALVVAGNRTCEPYWNRFATQSMVFSDGAAAVVVRRDHDRLRWQASEAVSDGRYADFYLLDVGGTRQPFTPSAAERGQPQARDAWDIMEFFDYDDEQFDAFARLITTRAVELAGRACKRVGAELSDIRFLIGAHDNARSATELAAAFGIGLSATNLDLGLDTGHLGGGDQIYSLERSLAAGALNPGDLVALVGLGRGMHWACTLIRI